MKKSRERVLAWCLSAVMCVSTGYFAGLCQKSKAATYDALKNPRVEMQTRDCIYFGNYWQENTNGDDKADKADKKTPIKWQILEEKDGKLLLLADQVLDCQMYNEENVSVTWETSAIRTWLNDEFYNAAFTNTEKTAIEESHVINEDNTLCKDKTEGGNDTTDNVFLLSLSEIAEPAYGFQRGASFYDQARQGKSTAYAKEVGCTTNSDGTSYWGLRSPGHNTSSAARISNIGFIDYAGNEVNCKFGIRPALRVNKADAAIVEALKKKETEEVALKKTIWDTVTFGTYNGADITWRVLSVDGEDAFLLADRILLKKAYNDKGEKITWENCTLRKWLNSEFYQEAFSKEEQEAIRLTTLVNASHPLYPHNKGGNDTTDKIYLLSLSDIGNQSYAFPTSLWCQSPSREAVPTNSVDTNSWWLRSPGSSLSAADYVDVGGNVHKQGTSVSNLNYGVRPALHLNLSSTVWTKGTEVTSEDKKSVITDTLPTPETGGNPTPTPTPTPEAGDNPMPTPTPELGDNPTPTPTPTPEPGDNPTPTPTPEAGDNPTPTPTPTLEPGTNPTLTPTPTPGTGNNSTPTQIPGTGTTSADTDRDKTLSDNTERKNKVTAPAKVKSLSVKNKKKRITIVSYKKVNGAKGYQLQLATNKKFTKGKKNKTITKTTVKIKKLKKSRTYYFRVRAYKVSDGIRVYGKWSSVKKCKIKK